MRYDTVVGAPRRHEATLERAGAALAAGSALSGLGVTLLVLLGGQSGLAGLAVAFLLGALFSALGILAVAGPLWLVLHAAGCRRAWHAAATGAGCALVIFVGAQTYGFGMLAMPAMDGRTLLFRWLSAMATGLIVALAAAAIALVMWRIAYRRIG